MAAIYTFDGNEITTGLQGCNVCDEAIQSAERIADDRADAVELHDDDGEWLVYPAAADGTREAAKPIGVIAAEIASAHRAKYG